MMNYENLIHEVAEIELAYSTMEALQCGLADGHQVLAMVPVDAMVCPIPREWFRSLGNLTRSGVVPEIELIKADMFRSGAIKTDSEWFSHFKVFSELNAVGSPIVLGKRIMELYQRRKAVRLFDNAANHAADLMHDHSEVIFSTAKEALDIMAGGEEHESPCGDEILDRMERGERFAVDPNSEKLAWFGIPELDHEIPASSGNLVIIAARPGRGKTAMVVQALGATSMDREVYEELDGGYMRYIQGLPSLFISLELPKVEAQARIASWHSLTRAGKFWAGKYRQDDYERLNLKREAMNRILVWAAPSRTPWSRIESKIRGAVLKFGVRVVAIDYFGLIGRPDPGKGSSPFYEAAKLSGQIRSLAQTLNICIILLCQLNREGAEGEPGMEDLRETGQLEQDAQTILALYGANAKGGATEEPAWAIQAGYTSKAEPVEEKQPTWIKVLKNRNGKSGQKYQMHFDGAINHFAVAHSQTR